MVDRLFIFVIIECWLVLLLRTTDSCFFFVVFSSNQNIFFDFVVEMQFGVLLTWPGVICNPERGEGPYEFESYLIKKILKFFLSPQYLPLLLF